MVRYASVALPGPAPAALRLLFIGVDVAGVIRIIAAALAATRAVAVVIIVAENFFDQAALVIIAVVEIVVAAAAVIGRAVLAAFGMRIARPRRAVAFFAPA